MRRTRPGVLLIAGLVLGVAVAGLGATPASAARSGGTPEPRRAIRALDAVPADSLVDSYGVGIHLNFLDTPYRDHDAVARALADLGVRHVRDDLFLDAPRQYDAIRTVARDAGVRFDLIMGRPDRPGTPEDYVETVATQLPGRAVESLEGVNEWDLFGGGTDWVTAMSTWQRRLYKAAKATPATADLPVLAPSLAFGRNYSQTGDLSPYADVANAHIYPGGFPPSNLIGQITQAMLQLVSGKPLITTEAGYHNAVNTTNGHRPVPEDVAGVYLPRLLLEHVLRGEQRVYSYELIDEFEDPGAVDPEAHFGLLRRDWSPKPAYTAMKNLLALLDDPGPSFRPGALAVAADGLPTDARYVLTEKRDGRFVLLLWRDVSVWDPVNRQRQAVTPADVTVRLDEARRLQVYRPSEGAEPMAGATGTSLPLQLDGQVTAITIDPIRPPQPRAVAVESGDGRATVRWKLPATSAAVTGFEVTREPGGLSARVGPSARSYVDQAVANGTTYRYSVRTLGADGASGYAEAPAVVPAGSPGRPRIVSATPGPRRVTLTWRPAADNGSPVTSYRLAWGGRTLTVASGKRRATITGLPAGRRVRVTLRAQNDIGWGPAARSAYVRPSGR